jgi:YNFM family putative membrane transporter
VGIGQASGLYLLAYYAGSSVFGSLAAYVWQSGGWTGVIAVSCSLTVAGGVLAFLARRFDARPDR